MVEVKRIRVDLLDSIEKEIDRDILCPAIYADNNDKVYATMFISRPVKDKIKIGDTSLKWWLFASQSHTTDAVAIYKLPDGSYVHDSAICNKDLILYRELNRVDTIYAEPLESFAGFIEGTDRLKFKDVR